MECNRFLLGSLHLRDALFTLESLRQPESFY